MTQKSLQKNASPLLILLIGVVCFGISLSLVLPHLFGNQYQKYERVASTMAPLATGTGVLNATIYHPDTAGPHPIVLLWGDGSNHPWNWELPRKWFPSAPSKTELVALLTREPSVAVETCYYVSTTVTRYRNDLTVVVREARTGQILASNTFRGDAPMSCPGSIPMGQTRIDGSLVALELVVAWLCPFVQGVDCP